MTLFLWFLAGVAVTIVALSVLTVYLDYRPSHENDEW